MRDMRRKYQLSMALILLMAVNCDDGPFVSDDTVVTEDDIILSPCNYSLRFVVRASAVSNEIIFIDTVAFLGEPFDLGTYSQYVKLDTGVNQFGISQVVYPGYPWVYWTFPQRRDWVFRIPAGAFMEVKFGAQVLDYSSVALFSLSTEDTLDMLNIRISMTLNGSAFVTDSVFVIDNIILADSLQYSVPFIQEGQELSWDLLESGDCSAADSANYKFILNGSSLTNNAHMFGRDMYADLNLYLFIGTTAFDNAP
ncbi:MAG: hypothetical protein IIA59_10565 [Candidatus Marinimicrobia bacterium]|nr:hypothetical protein [Candidatus Neomarinimicrobiota bacterium]